MKKLALLLAALMLLASLAACGGAASSTPTSTPASAPAANSTPAQPVTLNIAYMPNYASLATVVSGMQKGYFEEEGIKINLVSFADGPTIIAAMESGSIDIGYIGSGAHKLCIQGRAKIFAMAHVGNGDAVIGLKSKGVSTVADLKGKKVAYASGTSSESILKMALESGGMTMDDITAVEMDASAIVTAMLSGSIDACATWSPNTFTILAEKADDAIALVDNLTFADQSASVSSWIVLSDYASKNEEVILRFTRALYKAKDFRADEANYEQVAQWVAQEAALDYETVYGQRGDAKWLTSAELAKQVEDGTVAKLYESQQAGFIAAGAIEKQVPVEEYIMFDIMKQAAQ